MLVALLLLVSYVILLYRTWQQQRRCLLRAPVSWEMVAPTATATYRPAGTAALADGVGVLGSGGNGVPDSRWCGSPPQDRGQLGERPMTATRTKTAMSIFEACRPRRSSRNDRPDALFNVSDMCVRCRALARLALVPLCASRVVANKIMMSHVVYFLPPGRDCFSPRPPEQRDNRMAKAKSFAAPNSAPPSASVQRTQRSPPSPP